MRNVERSVPQILSDRARALEEAQKILAASASAGRALGREDAERLDGLIAVATALEAELKAARRAEGIAAASARPIQQDGIGAWNHENI